MLDKDIPYVGFWMTRKKHDPLPEVTLPAGYQKVFYQLGDEKSWAKIETAVGEFDYESEARTYFSETFAQHPEELKRRMLFIENPAGEKVATCTAWWKAEGKPLFHWLAVIPSEQGKGLAKYLTIEVTRLLVELGKGLPIGLHTQTWSYPAVRLYEQLGYEIAPIGDYKKAEKVLAEIKEKTGR